MNQAVLPLHTSGCPYLFLAPMEGVGDRPFRQAMATIGGFDEAVTEFIRVPINAHVESLARVYQSDELGSIPLAAQVMGSSDTLIAQMGQELEKRGAPRIDLNCGCPSNTVTGKGAGSSLLKNPDHLFNIARSLVQAVTIPVTIKMRSGYDDTTLFHENLFAAQDSGVSFITLHPRTKKEGYSAQANWDLIQQAKELLKIPVVGNGDIKTTDDALNMLKSTRCDALMIGRGAVIDPFIFLKLKAHFKGETLTITLDDYHQFLQAFASYLLPQTPHRTKGNKLKQLLSFMFTSTPLLETQRPSMLRLDTSNPEHFLNSALELLKKFS